MSNVYGRQVDIVLDNVGFDKTVSPKFMASVLQQISTQSANELGFGFNDLAKFGVTWVLVKLKIEFLKNIVAGDKITVKTWPLAPKHFTADRDYEAYNQNGEKVLAGTSVWALLDTTSRKLASVNLIKEIAIDYDQMRSTQNLTFAKFAFDDSFKCAYRKTVRISDLDINDHVNNTNYLAYAIDCLSKEDYKKGIKIIDLKFQEELLFDKQMDVFYKKQDQNHYVVGKKAEDQSVVFTAYIQTN